MVFGNSKSEVSKMHLQVSFYEFVYNGKLKRTFFLFSAVFTRIRLLIFFQVTRKELTKVKSS